MYREQGRRGSDVHNVHNAVENEGFVAPTLARRISVRIARGRQRAVALLGAHGEQAAKRSCW